MKPMAVIENRTTATKSDYCPNASTSIDKESKTSSSASQIGGVWQPDTAGISLSSLPSLVHLNRSLCMHVRDTWGTHRSFDQLLVS
jgi:hypothetical protein